MKGHLVFFVVATTCCVAVGTRSRGMAGRYVSDFMCHLLEEQGHSGEDSDDVCLGRSKSSRSSLPAAAAFSRSYTPSAPPAAAARPRRWMGGLSSFVALEERARRSGGGAATANTLASARTDAGTTRDAATATAPSGRVWPITGTSTPGVQSSPFGPRQLSAESLRFDFHRGIDIPVPVGTNAFAVDAGVVFRAGLYPGLYKDRIIQIKHTGWDPLDSSLDHYSTYLHMHDAAVGEGDTVAAGQLVGHTGASASGFAHLHFEIRRGGRNEYQSVNPWSWLPYADTPNGHTIKIERVVSAATGLAWTSGPGAYNVTVRAAARKTELDLDGVSVVALRADGQEIAPAYGWEGGVGYEALNRANTDKTKLDNPRQGNMLLEAERFTSGADFPEAGERVTFIGMQLPVAAAKLRATATDVKGNKVSVEWATPWAAAMESSPNGYIDYEAGALPIIITAPYGGGWTPAAIADRTNGCYDATGKTCTYSHSCGAPSSSCKVYSGRVGYVLRVVGVGG